MPSEAHVPASIRRLHRKHRRLCAPRRCFECKQVHVLPPALGLPAIYTWYGRLISVGLLHPDSEWCDPILTGEQCAGGHPMTTKSERNECPHGIWCGTCYDDHLREQSGVKVGVSP